MLRYRNIRKESSFYTNSIMATNIKALKAKVYQHVKID
jgi:hypothetical protein